ncbi:MAG: glycosyltransferase family 2 protein [Thiotrichales bacterium]
MISTIFWCSALLIAYTLVGYPVLVNLLARLRTRDPRTGESARDTLPSVGVVIAAYNEAQALARKLDSLLAQDYPVHKLSLWVVSDGSTDETASILARYAGQVRALHRRERFGKPSALNLAASQIDAEILVFTDARQPLNRGAVSALVGCLLAPEVGVAGGTLVQRTSAAGESENVGMYWRYEAWIRKAEAVVHSTAGASGALYAIRASDFAPIPEDTLLDDFEIPIRVLRKGKRIVLCENAQAVDEVRHGVSRERERKIRTLAGNYQSFVRNLWLFDPRQNPIWIQFLSHKVFRLLLPYFFVATLVSAWLLQGAFYDTVLAIMLVFVLIALLGLTSKRLREHRALGFCYAFAALNLASVVGLVRYLGGSADVRWKRS